MAIPSRAEAARILIDLAPKDHLRIHSMAVADVAAFLAAAIAARGHAINIALVEAAALLHDIDKALPANHPLKPMGHGDAGAQWLRDHDHGELAGAVANHPVMRLADDERYGLWIQNATVEDRVVAYADKRASQDLVPMDERFAEWLRKHGDNERMALARERANNLEQEVCEAAGIEPADVKRERWAESVLQLAQ